MNRRAGFRKFGTTADVGIYARGKSLASLFENAALGMYSITGRATAPGSRRRRIKVSADCTEMLLFAWLSELHYLYDAKGLFGVGFADTTIVDNTIRAELIAVPADSVRVLAQIKAVTLHKLSVKKAANGFRATVVFDL